MMETLKLDIDGVEVVWDPVDETFLVFALVSNGPDDSEWDLVDVFQSCPAAIDAAREIADNASCFLRVKP